MARYVFMCSCGGTRELFRPMAKAPKRPRCSGCGEVMMRDFSTAQFSVFKPYVEDRLRGEPQRFETSAQRDRVMKEQGLTYDSVKFWKKPERKYAIDEITLEEVRAHAGKAAQEDNGEDGPEGPVTVIPNKGPTE